MYHIDPSRTDLADEFRRNPFGPHSAELQKVLQILRWGPTAGKEILVCTVPYREWVIALIPERRGDKVTLEDEHPFHSVAEGLFAVFARRWQRHTGSALPLEWDAA